MPLFHIANTNEIDRKIKFAVEFKGPKKHSSDAQLEEQQTMREAGWDVITDVGTNGQQDINDFKEMIDTIDRKNTVTP